MLDWIIDGLRLIIWGLASACLTLMDTCFDLVKAIAKADFLSSSEIWSWYNIFMLFLGVLIIGRMLTIFLKFSFDEEYRDKISVSNMMNKLMSIGLVIALLPICLGFISKVSLWGINNLTMVIGTESSTIPSTFILTSFMNTDNGEFDKNGKWIEGENKVTYKIDDIDINEEGSKDDDYKFFNSITDLFILVIIGVAAAVMLIINSLQIGKRMYAIVMKVLIAPIPISSMIIPGDETFSMWRKMIISDYCLNYIQTLMIMIVMILSGSKIIQQAGVWVQIISFLAGLLLLLSGIPELAKIIGGDTSQASVLQQVASFRLATRGIGHSVTNTAAKALGFAGGGAAALGYGAGRLAGGQSISQFQKETKGSNDDNGFMGGGGGVSDSGSKGYSSNSHNKTDVNNRSTASSNMNSTSGDQNSESNNSFSALGGQQFNSGQQFDGDQSSGQQFAGSSAGSSNGGSGANGGPNDPFNNHQSSKDNFAHSSREGTLARQFSDAAQNLEGISGTSARFVSNASSHMYQASMKRMQNNRIYKSAATLHSMGAKRDFNERGGMNDGGS